MTFVDASGNAIAGDLDLAALGAGFGWDVSAFQAYGIIVVVPEPGRACLLLLGMLVSIAGQCGDLMLSSIKRDIGIKDSGSILPGGVTPTVSELWLTAADSQGRRYYSRFALSY